MDQTLVSWVIVLLEVIEKPPPLSYKFKEASAGMMIPNMNLKMFREVVDALAEQRYLNLWGTGISLMESELLNNLPPLLLNNCHVFSVSLLLSFFIFFFSITLPGPCKGEPIRSGRLLSLCQSLPETFL
jgi:hypothetical protein